MVETLGHRLRKLRESKHLKQEQVASLIDVTRSTICLYENDTRQPPYDILVRLAVLYRVTTDYLLGCQNQNSNLVDLSGLSQRDIAIVKDLVASMEERTEAIGYEDDRGDDFEDDYRQRHGYEDNYEDDYNAGKKFRKK